METVRQMEASVKKETQRDERDGRADGLTPIKGNGLAGQSAGNLPGVLGKFSS